jgi:tetratricopeptide (TPR) repeat protein
LLTACVLLLLALVSVARGTPVDDPDTEMAKRYFAQGAQAYDKGRYEQALERFRAAQRVKPLPDMDYNIARCLDRLDRPEEAIAAYDRFLASPHGREHAEVRERVEVLRARVGQAAAPPSPATTTPTTMTTTPPRRSPRYLAPGLVLGAALALGVAGTALWTNVGPRYDALDKQWRAGTNLDAVHTEARSLHAQENAGYVLWGVAGAVAVADLALWIVAARHGGHLRAALGDGALAWRF